METMQSALAVLFVLGLLGGGLFFLRAKGLARFNGKGFGRQGAKQMQSIERLHLTPHHSLHLVSVRGRTLLVAVSPGGCTVVDHVSSPISTESTEGYR